MTLHEDVLHSVTARMPFINVFKLKHVYLLALILPLMSRSSNENEGDRWLVRFTSKRPPL